MPKFSATMLASSARARHYSSDLKYGSDKAQIFADWALKRTMRSLDIMWIESLDHPHGSSGKLNANAEAKAGTNEARLPLPWPVKICWLASRLSLRCVGISLTTATHPV